MSKKKLTVDEILSFLQSIETGEIAVDTCSLGFPFRGFLRGTRGPEFYYSSNGWTMRFMVDDGALNDLEEIRCPDGRFAEEEDLDYIWHQRKYYPEEAVAWRRYRIAPWGYFRCHVCQRRITGEHWAETCGAWEYGSDVFSFQEAIQMPFPSLARYLKPMLRPRGRLPEIYRDVRESFDLLNLHDGLKMLTLRFWLDIDELPALPESLEHLAILNFDGFSRLPELPSTLKALTIAGGGKVVELPELPSDLECLCLLNIRRIEKLAELPPALKVLVLHVSEIDELPPLPETLEQLDLNCYSERSETNVSLESLPLLPGSLKRLSLSYCGALEELPLLPEGLQELGIFSCPAIKTNRLDRGDALSAYSQRAGEPSMLRSLRDFHDGLSAELVYNSRRGFIEQQELDEFAVELTALDQALDTLTGDAGDGISDIRSRLFEVRILSLIHLRIGQCLSTGLLDESRATTMREYARRLRGLRPDFPPTNVVMAMRISTLESERQKVESSIASSVYSGPARQLAENRLLKLDAALATARETLEYWRDCGSWGPMFRELIF